MEDEVFTAFDHPERMLSAHVRRTHEQLSISVPADDNSFMQIFFDATPKALLWRHARMDERCDITHFRAPDGA